MGKPTSDRVSRRNFLSQGAAAGALAVGAATSANAQQNGQTIRWDYTADVVVIGAGVAGLPAAITARDNGASVIIVEENYDIGGRGMLSGGRVQVGGGHALQQKLGIGDSADKETQPVHQCLADRPSLGPGPQDEAEQQPRRDQAEPDRVECRLLELGQARRPDPLQIGGQAAPAAGGRALARGTAGR